MNFVQLLKRRKKYLWYCLIAVLLSFLFFDAFRSFFTFALTIRGQECFPYKLWLIRKGIIPERGQYAAFKNRKVDGKLTWVKVVSGLKGDWIRVERVTEEDRRKAPELFKLYVDETGKELSVQAFVFLHSGNPQDGSEVFEAFEKDTRGKNLAIIEEGKIPKGKYFVSSPAVRSYDSRYWGLIDESDIIGKAYPIF